MNSYYELSIDAQQIARQVSQELNLPDHGVLLVVWPDETGCPRYRLSSGVNNKHSLSADVTSKERLIAHAKGFANIK